MGSCVRSLSEESGTDTTAAEPDFVGPRDTALAKGVKLPLLFPVDAVSRISPVACAEHGLGADEQRHPHEDGENANHE